MITSLESYFLKIYDSSSCFFIESTDAQLRVLPSFVVKNS